MSPAPIIPGMGEPSMDALQKLIDRLARLFTGYGAETAQKARGILMMALLNGDNPQSIAGMLSGALNTPLYRAQTVARTEMLSAYRSANIETMRANADVVQQWQWSAAPGACAMCTIMDGTRHDLSEDFSSHPNCFASETIVSGPRVVGSTARWYDGEIIDMEFTSGDRLTVTPNHPILTAQGWVRAGLLNEGGNVVRRRFTDRPFAPINPDDQQVEAPIEQVAATLRSGLPMFARTMPTTAEDFHGDGAGSQVHIVRTYGHLRDSVNTARVQPFFQQRLRGANSKLLRLTGPRPFDLLFKGLFAPTDHIMRCFRPCAALFGRHVSSHHAVCLAGSPPLYTGHLQSPVYDSPRGVIGAGKRQFRLARFVTCRDFFSRQRGPGYGCCARLGPAQDVAFLPGPQQSAFSQCCYEAALTDMELPARILGTDPGEICLDSILKITVRTFRGHVYNLQTTKGWYIANNIITHNCRCSPLPVTKSWSDILSDAGIDTSGLDLSEPDIAPQMGEDWLANQDAATQQAILGPAKYRAYQDGAISLQDVVGIRDDPVWGQSYYEKSLKEILGAKAQQYY